MPTITLIDPVTLTVASSGQQATNNANLRTLLNGGIDNVNIAAGAGISVSKISGAATLALVVALGS